MIIETTVNINIDNLNRLAFASLTSGRSKNIIVSSLLRRLAEDSEKLQKTWSRVRYQNRDDKQNWRRLHLTLRPDEYEFFIDMRMVFKLSVSYLIAYAVEKYLDEIMHKILRRTDNYRYKNYIVSRIIIDGVICWMQYWGIPRTLLMYHDHGNNAFIT
ncbi:MAG: hypothetical protein A2176_11185 [Spirochaetes bacterium RBG_13_51_14]|nr:MAG: hypothetical protein A2176_11185 [Spirochaetes bacterium RBG_13_51_14]